MQNPIFRLSIGDEVGYLVGYIDIPDPACRQITLGAREFIVLSRSTIDGHYGAGPPELGESRRREKIHWLNSPLGYQGDMKTQSQIENYKHLTNEIGNFDTRMYPEDRPWCMFNVMMISRPNEREQLAYRDAIGRIHVDAFLAHDPKEKIIYLE